MFMAWSSQADASASRWQPVSVEEAMCDDHDSVQPMSATLRSNSKVAIAVFMSGAALFGLAFQGWPHGQVRSSAPAGAGAWEEELQQFTEIHGQHTHHTEECMNKLKEVVENVSKTAAVALEKCKDVELPSGKGEDNKLNSSHWECINAHTAHNAAKEKHQQISNGTCDHDGFMHCTVTTFFNEVDYKKTSCFADVCKPSNLIKDRLVMLKNDAICKNTTKETVGICSVSVGCDGYEEVHMNYTGEDIDSYNLTSADIPMPRSGAPSQGPIFFSGLFMMMAISGLP